MERRQRLTKAPYRLQDVPHVERHIANLGTNQTHAALAALASLAKVPEHAKLISRPDNLARVLTLIEQPYSTEAPAVRLLRNLMDALAMDDRPFDRGRHGQLIFLSTAVATRVLSTLADFIITDPSTEIAMDAAATLARTLDSGLGSPQALGDHLDSLGLTARLAQSVGPLLFTGRPVSRQPARSEAACSVRGGVRGARRRGRSAKRPCSRDHR